MSTFTKLINSLFVFLLLIPILSGQAKIDPQLLSGNQKEVDYFVILKTKPIVISESLSKNDKGSRVYELLLQHQKAQQSLTLFLQNKQVYFETFYIINAIRVKSDFKTLNSIASRSDVEFITKNVNLSYDPLVRENESTRDPKPEWGINKILADSVWRLGISGQGVVVGGEDTGYDWAVSPLKKKYRGYVNDTTANHNYSWHDAIHEKSPLNKDSLNPCGYSIKTPCDDDDHGTHTMGTMVGQDSSNAIGVAPNSKWIGCRNMERGWGKLSTYLECFQWFLAPTDLNNLNPDPKRAPHVINNSWYCSEEEGCNITNWSALEMAVNNLNKAGVVVVVSAGNSGPNCNTISYSPALFNNSFSVGATDIEDNIAGFSSRGSVVVDSSFRIKPDVAAPGRQVRSVTRGGVFKTFNGTSMAGPHVAGLVALIISANPKLAGQVQLIQEIIRKSADPKTAIQACSDIPGSAIPNPVFGYGRINALKAVNLAKSTVVSTEEVANDWQNVSIFPNPTSDKVNLELPPVCINSAFQVTNTAGEIISLGRIDNTTLEIDLSTYASGLYLLQLKNKFESKFFKIIKL
jgi:serine protease AprX